MKNRELSIAICSFNAEKYIRSMLDSILEQSLQFFQLLIVDDHSSDNTVAAVKAYLEEKGFESYELIVFPENHGTAYVRNFALHHVQTPYMMFFDADDIAMPKLVEKLYQKISSDNSLIAVSSYCGYMDAEGNKLNGGIFLGPKTKEEFLAKAETGKMLFIPYAAMFRREWAIKAGGYRQAEWFPKGNIRYEDMSEDVDLWGRMSDFYCKGKSILVIPEILFYYRKNTNSLSTGFRKARVMGQKLMYIKFNQLQRRAGKPELKFQEYWTHLNWWKKLNFERKNLGTYFYRQACFAWIQRRIFRCAGNLLIGGLCSPLYPLEKYRANFKKKQD